MAVRLSVFCLLAAVVAGAEVRDKVTPLAKVTQMLGDMLSKAKTEKVEEVKRFAAFQRFVEVTSKEKQRDIDLANKAIEQYTADIAKALADAANLGTEIEELDANLNTWAEEEKNATAVRDKEHADYMATHKDYSESVDALARAIETLKARSADVAQAPALIALDRLASTSTHFPEAAKRALASLLQTGASDDSQAPEANAYEFQSGSIVAMLKNLKEKFQKEKNALEMEEINKRGNYELLMQKLHDNTQGAEQQRAEKAAMRARLTQDAARGKGDLSETTAMRDDDVKYLDELRTLGRTKSQDYESRQNLRKGEIDAITKAIEILSSPEVAGAAAKHLPALLQSKKTPALAQLRTKAESPLQKRAAAFLSEQAKKSNSRLLRMLADQLVQDPFGKVRKMIKDLIVKLMEEANEEASHKGWCDSELATNQQTRENLSASAEDLTAQVDELTALVGKLGEQLSELSAQIAALDQALAKATTDRQEEKATNTETIADAKAAQTAVAEAIQVLKEFYANAATATALAQQTPGQDAPETFDEPFKGQQDESTGIIGFLEVVQSDFARVEADTSSTEDAAQREFEKFSDDTAQDKAVKQTEIEHKTEKKQLTDAKLATAKKDLAFTQEELTAALDYYEKLKPSCIDTGLSYADRKARREEEIQSLKEALQILSGEAIAL